MYWSRPWSDCFRWNWKLCKALLLKGSGSIYWVYILHCILVDLKVSSLQCDLIL